MKQVFLFCLLVLSFDSTIFAQSIVGEISKELRWNESELLDDVSGLPYWTFDGGVFSDEMPLMTAISERIPLSGPSRLQARLEGVEYSNFQKKNTEWDAVIGAEIRVEVSLEQERDKFFARVRCLPVRRVGTTWERATKLRIVVLATPLPPKVKERGGDFTDQSVLASGEIYKFAVNKTGVTKLDYAFLKNQLKVANIDNLNPKSIQVYGNGGRMLSEENNQERLDDLVENAIFVSGEADGKFNDGDFILFYAEGPTTVNAINDPIAGSRLTHTTHLYDNQAYYFLKISGTNGLRIGNTPNITGANTTVEEFDDCVRYEVDKVNLLHEYNQGQGSGKAFFGDYFLQTRQKEYTSFFAFPNVVTDSRALIDAVFAARSSQNTTIQVNADGKAFSRSVPSTNISSNEANFANYAVISDSFTVKNENIKLTLNFPQIGSVSEGWLDFIEINARRKLIMVGREMPFRFLSAMNATGAFRYRLSGLGSGKPTVWDITDPRKPAVQEADLQGNVLEFGADSKGKSAAFVAFYDNADFAKPSAAIGLIPNQNLHALSKADLAIVYHPSLEAAVLRLAEHRRNFSGYTVVTIPTDKLYNEFSSGAKDPTAIRDISRMLLERDNKFRFLLLFGDGSFDPRQIYESEQNLDLVPVFETAASINTITAHPSDDFFALLSDGEGSALQGALDIAVGRIPCNTVQEAQSVVDKIITYDAKPEGLGDWQLRTLYVGDDEDSNVHIRQTEKLAKETQAVEPFFNIEKIYFDAYRQVATSGGQRYPDAKTALNTNIFKGALVLNYIGHGGPRGWGQERVLDNNDIAGWENTHRLPLLITATCSFGGYDDFQFVTGGELMILKPQTGAIAMFTTVRAVYIQANNQLTDAVQTFLFSRNAEGQYRTMGDILSSAKNLLGAGSESNARRFTMFGDPSQYLAMPELRVVTTKINGKIPDATQPDTLRALQLVELEGRIEDLASNFQSNFNGVVFVSVFDKKQTLKTLAQDGTSFPLDFDIQRNVLFKGSASVTNGVFKIRFYVPKDINYAYGPGKISYYAHNNTPINAAGADERLIIGGNSGQVSDDQPPLVQVFMNDDQFAFGGIANANPRIYAKLSDDYGINVSGTSIGHDLTAVVDDNVQASIVMNDFFQSAQDDFSKGTVSYPLRSLSPGRHTVRVKAWDIANNSGEGLTEFVVAESGDALIKQLLNYPNPFSTNTAFQFEHNLAGQNLEVQVAIYTVAGNLVKTINAQAQATGNRVTDVQWDGRDDFGDRIGRGVYLYRVKLRGTDLQGEQVTAESDFQKLVILK